MQNRAEALALLKQYTASDSLIKHALTVECAMRWYAGHLGQAQSEQERWGVCGLLHDFDYEKFPEPFDADKRPIGHPFEGVKILRSLGCAEDICEAILGHAQYSGTPRTSQMAKVLFACDELCGLITASVYVRPDKAIQSLELKSVNKRFKEKQFARGCNRDDIVQGAQELGVALETHMQNVLTAMKEQAESLGLAGVGATAQAANSA